ncbi:MAG: TonB-dependent receptor plug domain-containing protein, partial [Gammaproteobacteria bacterium]|nr:TonB-dependent receptor plug domain-containing protein [Gammaproteobacteria bacterium]
MNRTLILTVAAAALAIGFQAPSAIAEGAAPIEEIVVTARKKDESIIDVPISISLTTGADIQKQGFRDMQSIVAAVPAVNVSRAGGAETMNIRGTGSGENGGFEQSVGFVIDGMSVGRSRAVRAGLLDVERVEILKGPQTTYFGANTIAGVVSIVTRSASISDGVVGYVRSSYEIEAEEFVV